MRLLILTTALMLIPRIAISQPSPLSAEDFNKLRNAAIGNGAGRPLHSKVVAMFGLAAKTPILISEILYHGVGPNNRQLESSIWFSSTTDDVFFVEQVSDTLTIYHTDASRVLRTAAVSNSGLNDLHLMPNEQASEAFEAILRLWAKNASMLHAARTSAPASR